MNKDIIKELITSIKEDNLTHIKEIIAKNKGILDEVAPSGTFLHYAVNYGFEDVVNLLIDSGMDVNKRGGACDASAITDAAFKGRLNIVRLLYQNGAILDVSSFDRNPLFAAIYNNHIDVVKFLVEKGIDLNPLFCFIPISIVVISGKSKTAF